VPGQHDVAGQQRHERRDERQHRRHVGQQVAGAAVLAQHLVHLAAHPQVERVEVGLEPRPQRAERVVALAAVHCASFFCCSRAVTSFAAV
jgi:hypothetical protein